MRKIDTLPQSELVLELRDAIDAVRIADPIRGPSPAARKRLRRLIRENPHSVSTVHVRHNVGRVRMEWLEPLIESELGMARHGMASRGSSSQGVAGEDAEAAPME